MRGYILQGEITEAQKEGKVNYQNIQLNRRELRCALAEGASHDFGTASCRTATMPLALECWFDLTSGVWEQRFRLPGA
jgi:hypothetical protein